MGAAMRVGSLFSGIGGLELGLEWAGMTTSWQVERDPYALRVLAKHWPEVPKYDDIRKFNAADAPRVDLVCGGFPCQPHSLAGLRRASADERDLWGEFARVVCEARPRWVVAENVPGLLSSETGRFFGRVLGDLAALGFDAEWFVLPASAVGAPHRRERVFIVAHANGERQQERKLPAVTGEPGQLGRRGDENLDDTESVGRKRRNHAIKLHAPQGGKRAPEPAGADSRGASGPGWWAVEPDVGRVAHGVAARVDRIRCLGNAVVPQVAYVIGRRIMEVDHA